MPFRASIVLILLLEIGVIVLALLSYGWSIDGLQAVARFSGRLSLFIFSVIFLLHHQASRLLTRILSEKFFMVFAIAHGVHLVELLAYTYSSGSELVPYRLAGGMVAYALIFVMPWMQQRHEGGKISPKRFNQLSLVYLYYVWFMFVMTYVPRVMSSNVTAGGSYSEFVVLLGWVFFMLGIKVSQLLSRKRQIQRRQDF
jgi:hypothetical protein